MESLSGPMEGHINENFIEICFTEWQQEYMPTARLIRGTLETINETGQEPTCPMMENRILENGRIIKNMEKEFAL